MFADRANWNLETNRLSQALARHRSGKARLLDLTASNPTQLGFDYDHQAILRALGNPAALSYEPDPKGLEITRRAVAAYYATRGTPVPTEDIILTTSTSEAYSFVFRTLCNPGDEILVPEPSYPLFSFLADIQDVRLVRYPLVYDSGWRIDFHALEQSISPRTRGVIVVHPNNPTGHFCKPSEVTRLDEICSAHPMAVIADEVFLDFVLTGKPPASFVANTAALTFTLSGLSKISGLPQMKFAWLVSSGPPHMKSQALARLEVIADTYLSMNAPIQIAAPAYLELRQVFQSQLIARVQRNLKELDGQLAAQKLCSRLEIEGGWYVIVRVPATRPDEDLAVELLTTRGVYVHPGHLYDFPTSGYLVVSLITSEPDFAEGIRLVLSMF
jgi:alanine-synthesizing transaminase